MTTITLALLGLLTAAIYGIYQQHKINKKQRHEIYNLNARLGIVRGDLRKAKEDVGEWCRRANLEAIKIKDADAKKAIQAIEIALAGEPAGRTPYEVFRLAEMAASRMSTLIKDHKSKETP
jgi:hypothetical protein